MNKCLREIAQDEAIFNLYAYIADISLPEKNKEFGEIISELAYAPCTSQKDAKRLKTVEKAVSQNPFLKYSKLIDYKYSESGLTYFCFLKPDGEISVVFKGTGKGEWIDNGEGLSGIPEENTYLFFDKKGTPVKELITEKDYATRRQAEALNAFNKLASKHGWSDLSGITVSGHSKGGNKAQFITINSPLPDICISFCGQGFSPEAINMFKNNSLAEFNERAKKISSISADNDYINVLGVKAVPEQNRYYINSDNGWHFLECILNENGILKKEAPRGRLSLFTESVSDKLMEMPPSLRQYATIGVMNVFQKFADKDNTNTEKIISHIAAALSPVIKVL